MVKFLGKVLFTEPTAQMPALPLSPKQPPSRRSVASRRSASRASTGFQSSQASSPRSSPDQDGAASSFGAVMPGDGTAQLAPAAPPRLLGHERLFREAEDFKVKNTFIDGFVDEQEEEDLSLMGRRASCPAAPKAAEEADGGVPKVPPEAVPVPVGQRKPSMSRGALGHFSGLCRPCGWYWRPSGCQNGADCRHCHLCLVEEVKARKKKALKAKKALAALRRAHEEEEEEEAEDAQDQV